MPLFLAWRACAQNVCDCIASNRLWSRNLKEGLSTNTKNRKRVGHSRKVGHKFARHEIEGSRKRGSKQRCEGGGDLKKKKRNKMGVTFLLTPGVLAAKRPG